MNKYEDEYREYDYHAPRVGFRLFGLSLAAVISVLVIALVVGVITFAWAPWKGAREQRLQTQGSGSYRIAAYDHFYDLCAAVQAKEDSIHNVEIQSPVNKDIILLALNNTRNSLIRQYNADARKADTLAHFKASDLPYQIDPTQKETSCDA